MPAKSDGASGGGIWGGIVFMLILIVVALISSASDLPSPGGALQPTATSTSPETGPIVVNILNADVKSAQVRVVETNEWDDSDHNILALQACSSGQHISVWAPGYYIFTFPCVDGPTMHYDVPLEAVNTTDDPGYQWMSATSSPGTQPQKCANCHSGTSPLLNELEEWQDYGHSKAFASRYFWTSYMGTTITGQPSQQIQWTILDDGQKIYPLLDPMKPDFGAGYRLDYPVSNGNCASCHVPAGFPATLQETDVGKLINQTWGNRIDAATEGVTCDVCHKVTDVVVGKNNLPYDDRPGVQSMSILRPAGQSFKTGPLAFQTVSDDLFKRTCYPVFSESKFCASCHYGKYANTEIYGSYKEWLESPYREKYIRSADGQILRENPEYRSCQDCHMLYDQDITNTLPSERDACSPTNVKFRNFNHNMMKYGPDPENTSRDIPLLVKGAATITLEPRLEAGQVKIKATVVNTGAGHKFPTDSPLRHLILLIDARDWRENKLTQTAGPMVPVWAAPDRAGYAGEIYANILKDKDTNLAPSFAYWNPVENSWQGADTRLLPLIPVQSEYSFAAPYDQFATITAKLIYRKAFINVVYKKGWDLGDLDVKVTEVNLKCTGFGEVPEHMACQVVLPTPTP